MSGKWLLLIIFGVAFAMTGVLIWIHGNRDHYRGQALAGIHKIFDEKKSEIRGQPQYGALANFSEILDSPWKFEFIGDELWVELPTPRPVFTTEDEALLNQFGSQEVYSQAMISEFEGHLAAWFRSWLHKQASDEKRFPVRIRWQQTQ